MYHFKDFPRLNLVADLPFINLTNRDMKLSRNQTIMQNPNQDSAEQHETLAKERKDEGKDKESTQNRDSDVVIMKETQREDNNEVEDIAENKDETESFNKNNDVVESVDDENIPQATTTKNDGQKEVSLEEYMEVEGKSRVKRKAENNTGASPVSMKEIKTLVPNKGGYWSPTTSDENEDEDEKEQNQDK